MEIFLDTANVEEIKKAVDWGVISGVTTNPTLIAKEEGRDFHETIVEICEIVHGPVSAEVISQDTEGILREARELAKLDPHVVVKIPLTPEGLSAVKVLSGEGIRANVTLVFSALQALLAAKAGAAYVSPFIGRLDDIGQEGMDVLEDIMTVFENYQLETQVIAASIRHPQHVLAAARIGADIATVPFKVLKMMFQHPLTDRGIERFLADWEQAFKS
ncbi:MAG: fructose-6-phosphate aldolase [Syntrophaceticus sp.]|jgi:transaldolase